jgi:hypothetical protein
MEFTAVRDALSSALTHHSSSATLEILYAEAFRMALACLVAHTRTGWMPPDSANASAEELASRAAESLLRRDQDGRFIRLSVSLGDARVENLDDGSLAILLRRAVFLELEELLSEARPLPKSPLTASTL